MHNADGKLEENEMGIITKILRAREKQAELSVHAHLASFDDAALSRIGIKRKQLKTGGNMNFFM